MALAASTADPDSGTSTGGATTNDDAGSDSTSGSCSYAGTYTLDSYSCGDNDITDSWKALIPESTVEFTEAADGCKVVFTLTAQGCVEVEEQALAADGTLTRKGITSCAPANCSFNDDDEPCKVGDRATDVGASISSGADGKLTMHEPANTDNVCGPADPDIVLAP